MINLGHEGLNRLPEGIKNRISLIIAHYFSIGLHLEVTGIMLKNHFRPDFPAILDRLESWESAEPERSAELIKEYESNLRQTK